MRKNIQEISDLQIQTYLKTGRNDFKNCHLYQILYTTTEADFVSSVWAAGDRTRSQGYKTFFMLNSTEHEIFPTQKC